MLKTQNHLKKVVFQDDKCPILEYFHEIQLDEYKYTKTLRKYVCFAYKYHLSQKIYLINVEIRQNTRNKWYSKLGNAPSWNISMKSY